MSAHVVIVGGGPAGLLTALGLVKEGSSVTVIEATTELIDSPRALVYHHPVLPYLDDLGILDECIAEGFVKQDFSWHVHSTGEMIRWSMTCLNDVAKHPY